MKKIAVVTSTRADYGLLSYLMKEIKKDSQLKLQNVVAGTHLVKDFGFTYKEIQKDKLSITDRVNFLGKDDSDLGTGKSMSKALEKFLVSFKKLKPDLIVLLGDRYEILAAALAASFLKIPLAHIHGGELTEGAMDEAFRHSITKLSYLHFASAEEHKKRIVQLGEDPARVFNVGAIGVDQILETKLFSKEELAKDLKISFDRKVFLITYHPETLLSIPAEKQIKVIFESLKQFKDSRWIFTKSNADSGGAKIGKAIDAFVKKNPDNAKVFTSLGAKRYLSLMKYSSVVIGNSSSGVIETPYFGVPTVNIGDRQRGRMAPPSVIHCPLNEIAIINSIKLSQSDSHRVKVQTSELPYGNGQVSKKIVDILKKTEITDLKKKFYDL